MHIAVNATPYLAELFVATDINGAKHCAVIMKATFEVLPDGRCTVADAQAPFVFADEHYGDPATTAVRYECDFVPIKRSAEVLVRGSAIAPGGRPVTSLEVMLAGPGLRKQALVSGDRAWTRHWTGIKASPPAPFLEMPLSWDRSFGGSDQSDSNPSRHGSELRNLVGRGFHLNGDAASLDGTTLPNMERPDALMTSWADKPEPIGFGPVGRSWVPRIKFAGTYDAQWLKDRSPRLPADFDSLYFQSAPRDQQIQRLSPGDTFGCANMNRRGQFVVRIPRLEEPVRFAFRERTHTATLIPDTLILEPDSERVILVARASVPLPRKLTALREIEVGQPQRGVAPPAAGSKPALEGI